MALHDEQKLQGNVYNILDLLKKQVQCCRVASTAWASSSLIPAGVFVVIYENGSINVYDAPGGNLLTASEYGDLSSPYGG